MQDMDQSFIEFIRNLLAAGPMSGSQISARVRAKFPDFSPAQFQKKTFREVVLDAVPQVLVLGRTGLDVVYGFPSQRLSQPVGLEATDPATVWKIWTSPNSPMALVLDLEHERLTPVLRNKHPEDALVPPSVEDHKRIAREFLDLPGAVSNAELSRAISNPDRFWWQEWNRELKKCGLYKDWFAHREKALLSALSALLEAKGVPAPAVGSITAWVHRGAIAKPAAPSRPQGFRAAALELLSQMPDEDLMRILVPLGLLAKHLEN